VTRSRQEVDLTDQRAVFDFFDAEKPEYVFLAAAKVGGIHANRTYPAEFIYSNLAVQINIIHSSYRVGVKKLLFFGSSCIYPRDCPQPIKEDYLLTGVLEKTNEAYAVAKIAGLKTCEFYNQQYGTQFVAVMPTNLYGINDNFDLQNAHVVPALIRKIHEAKQAGSKEVEIWGSGKPRRELMFVDDMAEACCFVMEQTQIVSPINIGTGEDVTIRELAEMICKIVGFEGRLNFNASMPDGTPVKRLDVSRLNQLGWKSKIGLEEGLAKTYRWFLEHSDTYRK
jgi:GDP-L-fucose synthase